MHLIRGCADVHPLSIFFLGMKLVVVDSAVLDRVARYIGVNHEVLKPNAFAAAKDNNANTNITGASGVTLTEVGCAHLSVQGVEAQCLPCFNNRTIVYATTRYINRKIN